MPVTAPFRIQLSRAPGWRLPAGAVNVARPTIYGNPYRVGESIEIMAEDGMTAFMEATAEMVVALYRSRLEVWLDPLGHAVELPDGGEVVHRDDVLAEEYIADLLEGLRGKALACWCPLDQPCHADVLLEYANR